MRKVVVLKISFLESIKTVERYIEDVLKQEDNKENAESKLYDEEVEEEQEEDNCRLKDYYCYIRQLFHQENFKSVLSSKEKEAIREHLSLVFDFLKYVRKI